MKSAKSGEAFSKGNFDMFSDINAYEVFFVIHLLIISALTRFNFCLQAFDSDLDEDNDEKRGGSSKPRKRPKTTKSNK